MKQLTSTLFVMVLLASTALSKEPNDAEKLVKLSQAKQKEKIKSEYAERQNNAVIHSLGAQLLLPLALVLFGIGHVETNSSERLSKNSYLRVSKLRGVGAALTLAATYLCAAGIYNHSRATELEKKLADTDLDRTPEKE